MKVSRSRPRGLHAIVIGLLGAAVPLVSAAPPAVLDRVPVEGPAMVIALGSLERFDAKSAELLDALDIGAIGTLSQTLSAVGLKEGLEMSGSGAILFYQDPQAAPGAAGDAAAADGPVAAVTTLILLPVKDYGAFRNGLKAEADGALDRATISGEPYWLRSLEGGYAALSSGQKLVAAFVGKGGHLAAQEERLGAVGLEVASSSDLVAVLPPERIRPFFGAVLGPLLQGAPGMGLPLGGAQDAGADPRSSLVTALLSRLESDGRVGVVGVDSGPLGLRVDAAAVFRADTFMARACEGRPAQVERPAEGLRGLARQEFIFAGSMRTAHPGLRMLMRDLVEHARDPQEGPPGIDRMLLLAAAEAMENSTTASIAVYTPPSLFMGALSRTVMSWEATDPAVGVGLFRRWLLAANGAAAAGGVVSTATQPGVATVDGISADGWSVKLPAGAAPMSPMLYGGPEGPSGLMAVKGGRGYLTWSRDPALLSSALVSGAHEPRDTLAGDAMLASVAHALPDRREIEWYLSVRPVLQQLAPMMAMRPGGALDLPDVLPPVGAGVALRGGALRGGLFVPAPLLKLAAAEMRRAAESVPAGARGARPPGRSER